MLKSSSPSGPYFYDSLRASRDKPAKVIVAGAVALDLNCDVASNVSNTVNQNPSRGTSNPAIITQSPGGVGRNVATALHYCGIDTRLCSVVGDDSDGSSVLDSIRQNGMDMTGLRIAKSKNESTGRYVAFNDMSKSLYTAMADMRILESGGPTHLKTFWEPMMKTYRPAWLIIDANWDTSTISKWSEAGRAAGAMIAYEPVSAPKSTRILFSGHLRVADLATPNIQELLVMNRSGPQWVGREPDKEAASLLKTRLKETIGTLENDLMHVIKSFWKLLPRIPCIITKLGSEGVLLSQGFWKGDPRLEHPSFSEHVFFRQSLPDANLKHDYGDGRRFGGIYVRHLLPKKMRPQDIVCVNGVGDTFLGVLIAGLSQSNPRPLEELITLAQAGAVLTLQSTESVSPKVKGLAKLLGANTST